MIFEEVVFFNIFFSHNKVLVKEKRKIQKVYPKADYKER